MGERLDDEGEKKRGRRVDGSTSALLKCGRPDPLYIFIAMSGYQNLNRRWFATMHRASRPSSALVALNGRPEAHAPMACPRYRYRWVLEEHIAPGSNGDKCSRPDRSVKAALICRRSARRCCMKTSMGGREGLPELSERGVSFMRKDM